MKMNNDYIYDVFSQKIQEAINNGEAKVIIWDPNVK